MSSYDNRHANKLYVVHTKDIDEVVYAYLVNVYSKFGGSYKVLSDKGTEFKNKFFHMLSPL